MLDGVYLSTHEGRFVDVNDAFVKMFGYSTKDEMLDIKDIRKELYFSPEERGSHVLDTGKEEVEAYRMRRRDGSEIWVEDHGRYIHDKHGNVIYHEGMLRDITERKRAEEAVSKSEEKYRMIFQNSPLGLFRSTFDGHLLEVNPAMAKMFGYDSPESTIQEIHNVAEQMYSDPNDRAKIVAEQLRSSAVTHHLNRYKRRDGSELIANLYLNTVRDPNGQPFCLEGIVEDITEQKRLEDELKQYSENLAKLVEERTKKLQESEDALRAARERLEYAVKSNPAAIYTGKPLPDYSDWNSTFMSDRVTTLFGYKPEQFTDFEFWKAHVHPDDRSITSQAAARILKEGMGSFEYRFLHIDGTYRWIREETRVNFDKYGKAIEVYGYLTDITELKRSEETIRESEARYRRLFESSPISLWEEDFSEVKKYFVNLREKGIRDLRRHFKEHQEELVNCASMVKVLDVNEATLAMYGARSADELRGELRRIFPPEFEDNFREEVAALWDGKTKFTIEFDNQTLSGETKHVDLLLNVVPGYEDTLAKVLISIIDLTERRRMEQRLQQAERLAVVGETAAMVGHDLRNPLQGISGAVHLLKESSLGEKEKNEMLQVIEKCLAYSDAIVRDLTDYSSTIQLTLEEATPKRVVAATLGAVHVPQNIAVQDSTEDHPFLSVDLNRIHRVFVNLIVNALDAMPQGGTLTIRSKQSNGCAEIELSDTGAGMTEEVMENLWKPLHTTKAKGMGLGLAICKRIVEAHGGTISVKSRVGEGTTATVRIPLKERG